MDSDLAKMRPRPETSKWKIKKREIFKETNWVRFIHDTGKMANGKDYEYWYVSQLLSAGVIALTEKQEMLMVKQYRYLTEKEELALPGGGSKEPIEALKLAKMELKEETGYEGSHWEEIGSFDVANGYSNDIAHVFIARGCKKVGEQELDESEEGMTVELHSVEAVYEMVQEGKITDSFTLAALLLAWPHIL